MPCCDIVTKSLYIYDTSAVKNKGLFLYLSTKKTVPPFLPESRCRPFVLIPLPTLGIRLGRAHYDHCMFTRSYISQLLAGRTLYLSWVLILVLQLFEFYTMLLHLMQTLLFSLYLLHQCTV